MISSKIGNTVWFANGSVDLVKGKIIYVFAYSGEEHYVIEYDAGVDYDLVVRDEQTISDNPNKRLNMWRDVLGDNR